MSRITFFIVFMAVAVQAEAGPFGLDRGMTLSEIGGKPQKIAPGKYKTTTIPKPHSAFESYILQIGPSTGLCWIKAIGKNINTSVYGSEVRTAFADLKGKLSAIYGSSKEIDRLLPGSIWDEPRDWMMALLKKERILGAIWERDSGTSFPGDLKSVAIFTTALEMDTAFIHVEYAFTNENACEAEISKAEDSVL